MRINTSFIVFGCVVRKKSEALELDCTAYIYLFSNVRSILERKKKGGFLEEIFGNLTKISH